MTRPINIGRGSVGQSRLPRDLPSTGAAELGASTIRAYQQGGQAIHDTLKGFAGDLRHKREELNKIDTQGDLREWSVIVDGLERLGRDAFDREPEKTFRNADKFSAFEENQINELYEARDRFLADGVTDDARALIEGNMETMELTWRNGLGSGYLTRRLQIDRMDLERMGRVHLSQVNDIKTAEDNIVKMRAAYAGGMFTPEEQDSAMQEFSKNAYQAAVREGERTVGVLEAWKRFTEIPKDLDPAWRLKLGDRVKQSILMDGNPTTGIFGSHALKSLLDMTDEERKRISEDRREAVPILQSRIDALDSAHATFEQVWVPMLKHQGLRDSQINVFFQQFESARSSAKQQMLQIENGLARFSEPSGGSAFDPTNVSEVAAVAEMTLRDLQDNYGDNEDEYIFRFSENLVNVGHFPKAYAEQMRRDFLSGDKSKIRRAALAFNNLAQRGDFAFLGPGKGVISKEMMGQLLMVSKRVVEGEDPLVVYEQTLKETSKINPSEVLATFASDHLADQGAWLESSVAAWYDFTAPPLAPGMTPHFNRLTRGFLTVTGDVDRARELALNELKESWRITDIDGGGKRWAHHPPEILAKQGNTAWLKEQIVPFFEASTGMKWVDGAFEFRAIQNPRDPSGPRNYQVFFKTGEPVSFGDSDEPVIWSFDLEKDPVTQGLFSQRERRQAEADKALFGATMGDTSTDIRKLHEVLSRATDSLDVQIQFDQSQGKEVDRRFVQRLKDQQSLLDSLEEFMGPEGDSMKGRSYREFSNFMRQLYSQRFALDQLDITSDMFEEWQLGEFLEQSPNILSPELRQDIEGGGR